MLYQAETNRFTYYAPEKVDEVSRGHTSRVSVEKLMSTH